jgi:protein-tyrosine phosphatase
MDRLIPFDGIRNFRRFGLYVGRDGRAMRDGLYRSGHFSRASEADKRALQAFGLTHITDLRRPQEREREPSNWDNKFGVRVIESDIAGHKEAPHMAFLREGDHSLTGIRNFMLATYRRLPFDKGNQKMFAAGLRSLGDPKTDGFVVHCAAGKDRTGIFCALAQSIAGVDRDAIYEDYLMTNSAVDYDAIIPEIASVIEDNYGRQIPPEEMRLFLGVDADYLDQAFDAMGDPKAYIHDALGLTEDEWKSAEQHLLVS